MATRKSTKTVAVKKEAPIQSTSPKNPASRLNLKKLIIPIVIIALIAGLWLLRGQLVAATVNGQPISRIALLMDLEKKQGKVTLESMIDEALVQQEADKRNITVTDAEASKEFEAIKKTYAAQGQNLDELIAAQGMTKEDVNKQMKRNLLIQKLVPKPTVSDKEIQDYITQNKETIPEGTDDETIKPQIKQMLEQQKANEGISKFIQELRTKAKIDYLLKI